MSNTPQSTRTVTFTHPRDSKPFSAEVGPATTAAKAVDGMVSAGFLDASVNRQALVLVHQRTGKPIPMSASLVTSGVESGDTIQLTETSSGA